MFKRISLFVCALLATGTTTASATVIWNGDFQTGNISQWNSTETVNLNRLLVVTDPVFSGMNYSLQVLVEPGDIVYNGIPRRAGLHRRFAEGRR